MRVSEAVNFGANKTGNNSCARLEIQVLLSHILGITKEDIFKNPDFVLSKSASARFKKYSLMLKKGFPMAHITKQKEFYGESFYVDKNVLIPRPETELLVENTIEIINKKFNKNKKVVLADIGAGSGCIGISIALKCPNVFVKAVDISGRALKIAEKNAKKFGISKRVEFIKSSLLNKIFDQSLDIIAANLPYIGTKKYNFVSESVKKYEPRKALYSGKDGLDLYRKLFAQIDKMKYKPKFILGEFGWGQGRVIRKILNKYFVQKYEIQKDYAGIERIFIITL